MYIFGLYYVTQHNYCCFYQYFHSFLLQSSLPLFGYTMRCLSTHLLMDTWFIFYLRMLQIKLLLLLLLLEKYLGIKYLDHIVDMCLTF